MLIALGFLAIAFDIPIGRPTRIANDSLGYVLGAKCLAVTLRLG